MQYYVLAFIFNESKTKIGLIRKDRPIEQVGKLNGIGGKIDDDETPEDAVQREVKEETTLFLDRQSFQKFDYFGGDWGGVYCFKSFIKDEDFNKMRSSPNETEIFESHDIVNILTKIDKNEFVENTFNLIKKAYY